LKTIGSPFGRDHATVLHACTVIRNYIDTDHQKAEQIERYRDQLSAVRKVLYMSADLRKLIVPVKEEISEAQSKIINLQLLVKNIESFIEKIDI
jgi:hypothetical protein